MIALGYALGIWIVVLAMAITQYLNRPKYRKLTPEEFEVLFKATTRRSFISDALIKNYSVTSVQEGKNE